MNPFLTISRLALQFSLQIVGTDFLGTKAVLLSRIQVLSIFLQRLRGLTGLRSRGLVGLDYLICGI